MSETSLCVLFMPVLLKEMRCRLGMDLSAILFSIFFTERRKRLALTGLSSILIPNGAGWKIVLLFVRADSAVASCLTNFAEYNMSPLTSIHSDY